MKDLVDIYGESCGRLYDYAEFENDVENHPPADEEEREFLVMILQELHDGQDTLEK